MVRQDPNVEFKNYYVEYLRKRLTQLQDGDYDSRIDVVFDIYRFLNTFWDRSRYIWKEHHLQVLYQRSLVNLEEIRQKCLCSCQTQQYRDVHKEINLFSQRVRSIISEF